MLDTKQIASKPEDLGIEPERLEAVFARAKRDVDNGDAELLGRNRFER